MFAQERVGLPTTCHKLFSLSQRLCCHFFISRYYKVSCHQVIFLYTFFFQYISLLLFPKSPNCTCDQDLVSGARKLRSHWSACCTVPFSDTRIPSRTFLIASFLTVVAEAEPLNLKQAQYHFLQGFIHPEGLERQSKQHPSSSEPCGCIFHPRNFRFQPKTRDIFLNAQANEKY